MRFQTAAASSFRHNSNFNFQTVIKIIESLNSDFTKNKLPSIRDVLFRRINCYNCNTYLANTNCQVLQLVADVLAVIYENNSYFPL